MALLISYLVKLSISLAAVYLFYRIVLRRLTFYNWNRWYLLAYSAFSFVIPFINVYPVLEKNNWNSIEMMAMIPSVSYQQFLSGTTHKTAPWTYQDWTMLFILVGITIMLVRMAIQQWSFVRIRKSSTLLFNDRIKVYQVDKNIIPFSYGNAIFVNQHQHSEEELREIIRHEFIHVKQRHTIDILWGETLCILNWYNPFAWMLRSAIRQNLEFIADNKVLQNGIDKKEYQYLLLKVIGVSHFSIAPKFNFSSLKKRIAMMNKIKSARVHLLKFLFILPMMGVLLVSFRNAIHNDKNNEPPSSPQGNTHMTAEDPGKKQRGPRVDTLYFRDSKGNIKVGDFSLFEEKDVNGNRFALLLNGKEVSTYKNVDRSRIVSLRTLFGREARKKYGDLGKYGVYEMYTTDAPASMLDTIPGGKKWPSNVESISRYNSQVIVTLKDGTTEKYNFDVKDEKQAYEKKYGKYVAPPPPPPPPAISHEASRPPLPPPPPEAPRKATNDKGYVIGVIKTREEELVIVRDKNKKIVKTVQLSEWLANEKEYTEKYGELPPPPPPIESIPPAAPAPKRSLPEPPVPPPGIDHGIIIAPTGPASPAQNIISPNGPSRSVRLRGVVSPGTEPLFIIDGIKQEPGSNSLQSLNPNDIESINVLKNQSAIDLYGSAGIHGVIIVSTRGSKTVYPNLSVLDNLNDFKGLIMIDGVESTAEELNKLKGEDIESVNVLKAGEETQKYGEKGRHGVILIQKKSKKNAGSNRYVNLVTPNEPMMNAVNMVNKS